jgi:FkbM family methyltransferase
MKKLKTYTRYFFEYLKHGDIVSIIAAIRYLTTHTSHKENRIIQTSIGTFFCRKNTNDFQFANYKYEWGVKKYLLDNVQAYSVFIDGGACIGDYCILLSKKNIRCIAIEPVMANFQVLTKNLELNNLTHEIATFPFGLGEKNEQAHFVFNAVNTGASHYAKDGHRKDCDVDIRTLDSVFNSMEIKTSESILVKLDIEGMEAEAIRGAKNFILQYPSLIFVIEDKHIGEETIKNELNKIARFEYGIVDEFNIFAKKISNYTSN